MSLGRTIQSIRKSKGLTQGQLAENIATQSMISKIERDELNPSSRTLQKIAQKLNVPISDFFSEGQLQETSDQLGSLKKSMKNLLREGDYQTLQTIFDNSVPSETTDPFFQWIESILLVETKQELDEGIFILENLSVGEDVKLMTDKLLSLAIFYKKKEEFDKSDECYQQLLHDFLPILHYKDKAKVFYDYAHSLIKRNRLGEALDYVLLAIEILLENDSLYLLGRSLNLKGYILGELKEYALSIEAYEESTFIFKITGDIRMQLLTNQYKKSVEKEARNKKN